MEIRIVCFIIYIYEVKNMFHYIYIYEVKQFTSKMTEERETSVNFFGFLFFVILKRTGKKYKRERQSILLAGPVPILRP
jgi:hypothetical protein